MGRATDPVQLKHEAAFEASNRAAERFMARLAQRTEQLARFIEEPPDGETFIQSIQFKVNSGWDGGTLAIVKADSGGKKLVAFHMESAFDECVVGLSNRLANGNLQWKEDVPYGERNK